MRCLYPRNVGFLSDGKTLSWSDRERSKEFAPFQIPCGKCIECRLEYARIWAVRCVHEAKMHHENSFVTLTYSDEHLKSPKLIYRDFQLFMKKLRLKYQDREIPMAVTGEYGEKNKRPHWHALIFNWRPEDAEFKYTSDRGDRVWRSQILEDLWDNKGQCEFGDITFESAGYVMRYSAKKLVHGFDGEHGYDPISKKSSKYAIGRSFIEEYWKDVFSKGYCVLENGSKCAIPRYYERWLKQHKPEIWEGFIGGVKLPLIKKAGEKAEKLDQKERQINHKRLDRGSESLQVNRLKVREILAEERLKRLNGFMKGDI